MLPRSTTRTTPTAPARAVGNRVVGHTSMDSSGEPSRCSTRSELGWRRGSSSFARFTQRPAARRVRRRTSIPTTARKVIINAGAGLPRNRDRLRLRAQSCWRSSRRKRPSATLRVRLVRRGADQRSASARLHDDSAPRSRSRRRGGHARAYRHASLEHELGKSIEARARSVRPSAARGLAPFGEKATRASKPAMLPVLKRSLRSAPAASRRGRMLL
jgi:hypothetical protein